MCIDALWVALSIELNLHERAAMVLGSNPINAPSCFTCPEETAR
jgi:hypothetical protein